MQTATATTPKSAPPPKGKMVWNKLGAKTPDAAKAPKPQYPQSLMRGHWHRFDYSQLKPRDAEKLHNAAVRIRGRESKSMIEDGKDFIRIKDLLPHGDWTGWIVGEDLAYNVKSVERAMSVARLCEDRSKHLEALPKSTLYDLAAKSIPDAVKDAVSGEADKLGRAPDLQWVWKQISAAKAEREAKKPAKAEAAKKDVATADPEGGQPSDDLQEVELREQKTHDLVVRLVEAFGDDFPAIVDMFDAINFMEFKDALHHARSKFAKAAA